MRSAILATILLGCLSSTSVAEQGLKFALGGSKQTILPLGYSNSTVLGLKRNGYMVEIKPDDIKNPTVVPRF